jgi:circadian clock protein KaiC
MEATDVAVSSMVDTWILVKALENNGERTRGLYILKSRGMPHSNQVREFLITDRGIDLIEPYIGPEGVLTGTARLIQEAREDMAGRQREMERERAERLLERKRALLERRISELRAEFAAEEVELAAMARAASAMESQRVSNQASMSQLRGAGAASAQRARRAALPGKVLRGKKK